MKQQGDFEQRFGIPYPNLDAMVKDGFKAIEYQGVKGPLAAAALVVFALKTLVWRGNAQQKQADKRARMAAMIAELERRGVIKDGVFTDDI